MTFRSPEETKIDQLTGLLAFFLLLLIGMTASLWKPQSDFPQVPFIGQAIHWPVWLEWGALTGLLVSATGLVTLSSMSRWPFQRLGRQVVCLILLISWILLVLFDQHRLQPWAYQFAIGLFILANGSSTQALKWFQWLVISIYFYSAVSKLDFQFMHTQGPQLLEGLFQSLGVAPKSSNIQGSHFLSLLFPLIELSIAGGLAWANSKRMALYLSLGMHATLLLSLGPWGLNHEAAVLGWNIYFILQNLLLFGFLNKTQPVERQQDQPLPKRSLGTGLSTGLSHGLTVGVLCFVLAAPCLGWLGYYDLWPSWGLYSTVQDRVTLLVAETELSHLPRSLKPFVDATPVEDGWYLVRTDRWSLAALKSPIYPQARFQLGVARAVGERLQQTTTGSKDKPKIKIVLAGPANRFTGRRLSSTHLGLAATNDLANLYWLNTKPHPRWIISTSHK